MTDTSCKPEFNPSGDPTISMVKASGDNMRKLIEENIKPGRRRSIALTELESALMWAVKAVAYPGE